MLAWRPPPDAAPLPPSRSLGRALSLWSRALEPPSAPALLGAGARRTLHSTKSMLAPPHLHSLARLLSMAEGMPEGGSGSGSGLVTPTSAAAKAGSQAAEAIAANPSDTAGERNGHAVHFDDATLQSLAHTSPALRLRGSAAVAEEAVSEVQASGPSLAPASGPARHQAKQSRRQALARAAAALAQAALVAAARAALIAAEPLLVLVLRSIVRSRR